MVCKYAVLIELGLKREKPVNCFLRFNFNQNKKSSNGSCSNTWLNKSGIKIGIKTYVVDSCWKECFLERMVV